MQLHITLEQEDKSAKVPINYNYFIQSAIYSNLEPELSNRLHDQGYKSGGRIFKMFTFSRLRGRYVFDKKEGMIGFPGNLMLSVSSPDVAFLNSFANTILHKSYLRIGKTNFKIIGFKTNDFKVLNNRVRLKTLSPIVIYSTLMKPEGGKYTCYYQPGEHEFLDLMVKNLCKKYSAFYGDSLPDGDVKIHLMNRPRLHVMNYKGIVVKGYSVSMELIGPNELLQIGLDAGLGSKNSQGFGCVEPIGAQGR